MDKAVSRIIDANLNRTREALRVMEDYARFALNDRQLSGEIKEARQQLRQAIETLGPAELLSARNTPGDVGTELSSGGEMQRTNSTDVVTAACKRVVESVRVLEEFSKTVQLRTAKQLEQLRYKCYEWEVQLLSRGQARKKLNQMHLYVIITSGLCRKEPLQVVRDVLDGGADCLQLREKQLPSSQYLDLAEHIAKLCHEQDKLFIVNDRPDIAIAAGADGVHLGQDDLSVAQARKILPGEMVVGVSTHSIAQARQAALDEADYIGVGPVFATSTKPSAEPVGLDYVRQTAAEFNLPQAAIGGITLNNLSQVIAAGAKAVAVCSAIISADNPGDVTKEFAQRLNDS